jgi:hypothetical protein
MAKKIKNKFFANFAQMFIKTLERREGYFLINQLLDIFSADPIYIFRSDLYQRRLQPQVWDPEPVHFQKQDPNPYLHSDKSANLRVS